MMISRFSTSSRGQRSVAVPSLSPQYRPIPWRSCTCAAARNPRSAVIASGAPVWLPAAPGVTVVTDPLVVRQAAATLTSTAATINFFIRSSSVP